MMQVNDSGDILRVYDEINRDVLVSRRLEVFFEPNADGSPSVNGKLIWHTEWEHRTGDVLRGKSIGPRIERPPWAGSYRSSEGRLHRACLRGLRYRAGTYPSPDR
jgi:hypothetical protein